MFRELLRKAIEISCNPNRRWGLAFSGGTDSTCILLAALDVHLPVELFTYHLQGMISQDLKKATTIAASLDIPHTLCPIPTDSASLQADIRRLVALGVRGQVRTQCCHGHLYVASAMAARGITGSLNGSGIDGVYGVYKSQCFGTDAERDVLRREQADDPTVDAIPEQRRIYGRQGISVVLPYRYPAYLSTVLAHSWRELNRPRTKGKVVAEFPEIAEMRSYRPRGSQQLVCGIPEFHARLLDLPINQWHCQSLRALYSRLSSETPND